jgi:hypothetical protein
MTKLWRWWVALWDRREPATALALVRIGIAVVLLADYLWIARLGMVHAMWSRPPLGYGGADAVVWYGVLVAALACIGLGAATPLACVVFAYASARLSWAAPDGESGSDILLRIVVPILALSRCNARWSIDAWVMRRLGRPMATEVPAWPRYLIMLQLVWVYFSGAQNKSSAVWGPFGGFTALGNALMDPGPGRLPVSWVAALYPLTRVATALTMVFEWAAPLYLLAYAKNWRVRWVWLALGVFFELGIAVGLRLGSFPYAMLALFPALLRPEDLQRLNTRTPANRASSPS